ncbi:transcriptional regulator [Polynucleobacter sp. AP-RePozz3-80-G7]|uniref:transcriptional regulator n=1 Tax=Polynucleobacter sp. AP-RePozz3-80-G7 TaxID=2689105 RepID=UPI001C0C2A73|nr:transcriptional regulator [Polynucleobacter sp. AP-RePozz3-80-G7]MBU3639996.1 transcriptional regulator [Polynucleobacter sp. AP-RePozz3-80-G7]
MSTIEKQGELGLVRQVDKVYVPIEMIHAKKTGSAAFTLACDTSNLEDKEIYLALGIDAGYFSNIKKGKATLQVDLIADFCKIVGNTIYPEWIAYQVGYTMVMLKTEAERRAEVAEEKLRATELENRLMRELLGAKL